MMKNSKINSANYTSMSSYSRDLAFLHDKAVLQAIPSKTHADAFEQCLHGGYSATPTRLALNSKFFSEDGSCAFSDEKNYYYSVVTEQDANNLYGQCMTEPNIIGGFTDPIEIDLDSDFDLKSFLEKSEKCYGYIFMIDATLPDEFHDGPEGFMSSFFTHEQTRPEEQSAIQIFSSRIKSKLSGKAFNKIHINDKNHNNIKDKIQIWEFSDVLLYAMENGWKVRPYKYIRYIQEAYTKDYVLANTEKRIKATLAGNMVESNILKYQNNSCFGSMCMQEFGRKKLFQYTTLSPNTKGLS